MSRKSLTTNVTRRVKPQLTEKQICQMAMAAFREVIFDTIAGERAFTAALKKRLRERSGGAR